MKIVFYSLILNNHQANVADELWELTNHQYCFVELANLQAEHKKGDTRDYSSCPYLLRAWESSENYAKAMGLARTAECCVFSGVQALPFQKERLKLGLLSFDMSERWLKRGIKNVLSPAISKMYFAYWVGGWKNKPLYKLCMSAFAAGDHYKLGMYKEKCYKWGYFTQVDLRNEAQNENENLLCGCENVDSEIMMQHQPSSDCSARADVLQSPRDFGAVESTKVEASTDVSTSEITPFMWCSRFLKWKHPELPILMAEWLKQKGYTFYLDMYGEGELRPGLEVSVERLGLSDVIKFHDNMPNADLMEDMRRHEIFLFTSDRNEGWGAVANESMSNGCVLVGSDALGCAPYLIKDGENGFMFKSSKVSCSFGNPDMIALDSLYEKVVWLLEHPMERKQMQRNAIKQMQDVWSPRQAAQSLIQLIDDIKNGRESSIEEGPCSKA